MSTLTRNQLKLLTEAVRRSPWNDEVYYLKATAYEANASGKSPFQPSEKRRILNDAQREILKSIRLRPSEAPIG